MKNQCQHDHYGRSRKEMGPGAGSIYWAVRQPGLIESNRSGCRLYVAELNQRLCLAEQQPVCTQRDRDGNKLSCEMACSRQDFRWMKTLVFGCCLHDCIQSGRTSAVP
ncbi:unnamed protein product [Protopolystoma xenopodis]|uniref:Uncharacterized protein n=1 Tax=Protopolystoma xenopodis TaxID=117903 RepID=A0A448WTY5_9PLAT|nr:unnamed protein product [Protopolystoma xenopodis]